MTKAPQTDGPATPLLSDRYLRSFASRPLTDRVRDELARSIAAGFFADGWLPSESELSERLSVSRPTLRSALRSLEDEGIVTRQRGRGTRINSHIVRGLSLTRVVGFYDLIKEAGFVPRIDMTSVFDGLPNALCLERLRCAEDEPLVVIERRLLANELPAVFLREMVLDYHITRHVTAELVPETIFEFSTQFCDHTIDHTVVEIQSAAADKVIGAQLGLRVGEPCLRLIETHYSPDGVPFIASDIYLVDRYIHLIVVRRRY